jgi:5-methyltetrahydropteroyltriglutamate--homocysteine methyltransferase
MVAGTEISSVRKLKAANLGFPRMGRRRELKFALEGCWTVEATEQDELQTSAVLRKEHGKLQQAAGIDLIPSNDFSLDDQRLDALALVGATPERFGKGPVTVERYFSMAG